MVGDVTVKKVTWWIVTLVILVLLTVCDFSSDVQAEIGLQAEQKQGIDRRDVLRGQIKSHSEQNAQSSLMPLTSYFGKEGSLLGINGLPWGARIPDYNASEDNSEAYKEEVWHIWQAYLTTGSKPEGYLWFESYDGETRKKMNPARDNPPAANLVSSWSDEHLIDVSLLKNKQALVGAELHFSCLIDGEKTVAFIQEVRRIFGGGLNLKKGDTDHWMISNVVCSMQITSFYRYLTITIRIVEGIFFEKEDIYSQPIGYLFLDEIILY